MTKKLNRLVAVLLIILSTAWSSPSLACLGVMAESATFLHSLPEEAQTRAVVAKVEIIETIIARDAASRFSVVEVIEPIKGSAKGDRLKVVSETHSCARDHEVKAGERYFIAGSINPDGAVSGVWKNLDLTQ